MIKKIVLSIMLLAAFAMAVTGLIASLRDDNFGIMLLCFGISLLLIYMVKAANE